MGFIHAWPQMDQLVVPLAVLLLLQASVNTQAEPAALLIFDTNRVINSRLPPPIRNFTASHDLHWFMFANMGGAQTQVVLASEDHLTISVVVPTSSKKNVLSVTSPTTAPPQAYPLPFTEDV